MKFKALAAFGIVFTMGLPAAAATYDLQIDNKAGAIQFLTVVGGKATGLRGGRGKFTMKVTLPDGKCSASMRIRYGDGSGLEVPSYNFCIGTGLKITDAHSRQIESLRKKR